MLSGGQMERKRVLRIFFLIILSMITILACTLNYNIISDDIISSVCHSDSVFAWSIWEFRLALPENNMFWFIIFPVIYKLFFTRA